jgi:hypothetical protein
MIRSSLRIATHVLGFALAFGSVTAAVPGAAEGIDPGTHQTRIPISGSFAASTTAGRSLVFENRGASSSRILIPSRQARGISCATEASGVSRSRAGQYTLSGGAELFCVAEPGRYRVTVMSAEGGSVREKRGELIVR